MEMWQRLAVLLFAAATCVTGFRTTGAPEACNGSHQHVLRRLNHLQSEVRTLSKDLHVFARFTLDRIHSMMELFANRSIELDQQIISVEGHLMRTRHRDRQGIVRQLRRIRSKIDVEVNYLQRQINHLVHPSTTRIPCPSRDSFVCPSGQCIPRHYVCDGYDDCRDNSDERYCRGRYTTPRPGTGRNVTNTSTTGTIRFPSPIIEDDHGLRFVQGHIEIMHDGIWGTICDDHFSIAAATVLCRMAGYASGDYIRAFKQSSIRKASKIWLDDVRCTGQERNIDACQHLAWGVHNCHHNEDVGIRCYFGANVTNPSTSGAIRFPRKSSGQEDGLPYVQGHIEISHNGTWGTICDDYFNNAAATVLCRMAGYDSGVFRHSYKQLSVRKASKIWLDDVRCNGHEKNIGACRHRAWGAHDCRHNEDVGIRCYLGTNVTNSSTAECHGTFRCHNSGRCISRLQICDGFDNCGDYSDERNCRRARFSTSRPWIVNYTTPRGRIGRNDTNTSTTGREVNSGKCTRISEAECRQALSQRYTSFRFSKISNSRYPPGCYVKKVEGVVYYNGVFNGASCTTVRTCICQGGRNVTNTSTTVNYTTPRGRIVCSGYHFRCHNNRGCVHPSRLCDGRNDCGDYSDERHCRARYTTPEPQTGRNVTNTSTADLGSEVNSGKCTRISEAECRKAWSQQYTSFRFSKISNSRFPAGCYVKKVENWVYYNGVFSGASCTTVRTCICQGGINATNTSTPVNHTTPRGRIGINATNTPTPVNHTTPRGRIVLGREVSSGTCRSVSETECRDLRSQRYSNFGFTKLAVFDFPPGCYVKKRWRSIYYNTARNGAKCTTERTCICKD